MIDVAPWAWAAFAVAAFVGGMAKTAAPGAGTVSVVIVTSILPARTATAATLLLFIAGDIFALIAYRRHAHWPTLLRLAPAVVAGLLLGFLLLTVSDDDIVRRVIGVLLLFTVALTLWRRRGGGSATSGRLASAGYGTLAGFTTMVANTGGAVMAMYFLAARAPINVLIGTSAWFFAIVNMSKVPFLASIGLFTPDILLMGLVLAPVVAVGALAGTAMTKRISQTAFDRMVIILTVLGAAYLLI